MAAGCSREPSAGRMRADPPGVSEGLRSPASRPRDRPGSATLGAVRAGWPPRAVADASGPRGPGGRSGRRSLASELSLCRIEFDLRSGSAGRRLHDGCRCDCGHDDRPEWPDAARRCAAGSARWQWPALLAESRAGQRRPDPRRSARAPPAHFPQGQAGDLPVHAGRARRRSIRSITSRCSNATTASRCRSPSRRVVRRDRQPAGARP